MGANSEKKSYISKGTSHKHKFAQPNIKWDSATGSCSTQRDRISGSCLTDPHANCNEVFFSSLFEQAKRDRGSGSAELPGIKDKQKHIG